MSEKMTITLLVCATAIICTWMTIYFSDFRTCWRNSDNPMTCYLVQFR